MDGQPNGAEVTTQQFVKLGEIKAALGSILMQLQNIQCSPEQKVLFRDINSAHTKISAHLTNARIQKAS